MTRPRGSPADRLRAAVEKARVPAAVIDALNASPPDPARGQIWRARWQDRNQLILLRTVNDDAVAAPVALDVALADDSAAILNAEDTTLRLPMVQWPALARPVPIRILDRWVGELTSVGASVLNPTPGEAALPGGRPVVSPVDPRAEYRAMLEDTMTELAEATWVPAGTGVLGQLLRTADLGPAELTKALHVQPQQALALLRGQRPVTVEQAAILASLTRSPAEALIEANPPLPEDLVSRLDRPAARALIRRLADQRHVPEIQAWQDAGYEIFALAARQTGTDKTTAWDQRIDRYFAAALDD